MATIPFRVHHHQKIWYLCICLLSVWLFWQALEVEGKDEFPDDRCGPKYGHKKCSGKFKNDCCSYIGTCGRELGHCSEQSCLQDYGVCPYKRECGPGVGNCTDGKCCDQRGLCSRSFCGAGCQPKYGYCAGEDSCGFKNGKRCSGKYEGHCCSNRGDCGKGPNFCSYVLCDKKFGPCGNDDQCGRKECTGEFKGQCCNAERKCVKCPPKKDDQCGPKFLKPCEGKYKGQCCRNDGKCGTGEDFCHKGVCDHVYTKMGGGNCATCTPSGECKFNSCTKCHCCGRCTENHFGTLKCVA